MAKRQKKIKEVEEDFLVEEKKTEARYEKQIKNVIIFSITIILLFLATYYGILIYKNYQNTFEYRGLEWHKEGKELVLYKTEFKNLANSKTTIYFRGDPRENNLQFNIKNIGLNEELVVSFDEDFEKCEYAAIAHANLVYFLRAGLGISPTVAMFNKTQAEAKNLEFINCSGAINKTVMIFKKSDKASIDQDLNNKNCYIISVGDCENFKAVEKFMLEIISIINKNTN